MLVLAAFVLAVTANVAARAPKREDIESARISQRHGTTVPAIGCGEGAPFARLLFCEGPEPLPVILVDYVEYPR